ncbi:bifunctional deaminase-reductase-like protein [Streptomyces sparsogenes DSM 40356]|uniref:Bifunctional deaminase-reductase-like protein n=1 Tax=Streptomyces sparsogenes DSM 40356 TaxID=1331668 RepID=A0A1R1S9Q4_9ACTN|nr:bifunctional deaminase-reductase-like protein [Streptomyces sparsogenes DSM 40356]
MTVLDETAAWELLRAVRSEADAEAAGLSRGPDGGRRWRREATPGAHTLVDRYLPLCLAGTRVTFAQLGQSLDGFIATRTGDADYVTGEEDRAHLHRLRALADAVVVGAGTAVADDPQLTVRACAGTNPVRVVLDPHGRVPPRCRVFTDGSAPTLWVVAAGGGPGQGGLGGHVDVLTLPDRAAFGPRRLVETLARRGLGRVLVEGGGVTVSRFLHERALDRLYVTVAPVLLGDGVPGLRFTGTPVMREALRPPTRRAHLGEDTLFEIDLRTPRTGAPLGQEHAETGQARGEGEHPVHHGDGQPLGRAQARGAEGPGGDALPGPPAADVQRQRHGEQRQHHQGQQLGRRSV